MTDSSLPILQGMHGKRVAILGCGDIGVRLARQLLASGAEVMAFRRQLEKLPKDIPAIACDFSDPDSLRVLAKEHFDYAVLTLIPARGGDDPVEAYRQGYLKNLGNILEALPLASIDKLLWVSSTSVYAQDDEGWVDETSETEPTRETGRILLQAEAMIRQLGEKGCIVRFSGIYRENQHRMVTKLQAGELAANVDKDYYTNRIHVVDCAGILGFLLQKQNLGAAIDPLYIGSDCLPVRYTELVDWLAEASQLPLNKEEQAKKPAVGSKQCRNDKLLATGYQFIYPTYKEGFAPLIQRLQAVETSKH